MKYINIYVFVISFLCGVSYLYFDSSATKLIDVYVTEDNKDKFQLKDSIGNCFLLEPDYISCPHISSKIMDVTPK